MKCEVGLLVCMVWWGSFLCTRGWGGFGSCWVLIAGFQCLWKEGGCGVALTLLSPPYLPRQSVIHPVWVLNECNEACCPYHYTHAHTHTSHTNIPWQTRLSLSPPILPLHFPHQGSSLCNCVCLWVVERAFLLPSEKTSGGRLCEGARASLVYLHLVHVGVIKGDVCVRAWS